MNLARGGEVAAKVLQRRQQERVFLRLAEQVWQVQGMLGGFGAC